MRRRWMQHQRGMSRTQASCRCRDFGRNQPSILHFRVKIRRRWTSRSVRTRDSWTSPCPRPDLAAAVRGGGDSLLRRRLLPYDRGRLMFGIRLRGATGEETVPSLPRPSCQQEYSDASSRLRSSSLGCDGANVAVGGALRRVTGDPGWALRPVVGTGGTRSSAGHRRDLVASRVPFWPLKGCHSSLSSETTSGAAGRGSERGIRREPRISATDQSYGSTNGGCPTPGNRLRPDRTRGSGTPRAHSGTRISAARVGSQPADERREPLPFVTRPAVRR